MQFVLLGVLLTAPRLPEPYGPLTPILSLLGLALMALAGLVLLVSFVALGSSLTASPLPKAHARRPAGSMTGEDDDDDYSGIDLSDLGL